MSSFNQRYVFFLLILTVLLSACASAAASSQQAPQRSAAGPLVHLPADQASHPGVHNEWWYVVGHLRSGARTFGFEVTLFKFWRVRLPGMSAPVTIYRTDVAITDEKALRFHQRVTYYFPQSASLSSQTLKIKIGSASLHGVSLQRMSLNASLPAGRINLGLSSRRPPMYVGGRGYIPFSGGYTYYYSLTNLATHGSITLKGVVYRVTGISWLDHQWGNWSWTATSGWTWMALQLNNGRQLSIFDVRSKSVPYLAASVLTPSGTTQTVRGVTVRSLGKWRSPHTRATYPSGWIVTIPALRATLHVAPTVRDQEVVAPQELASSYWEGSGRVSGTFEGKSVTGLSYTELTGYAGRPAAGNP